MNSIKSNTVLDYKNKIRNERVYSTSKNKIVPSKTGYINVGLNRSFPNKLYYETYGNGLKKILFICGFLTPLKSYIKQVDYFARLNDEYEICLYDNRGISQSLNNSLQNSYNFSSKSMANDALDVVNHLGWENFNVVGLSMGGMASLHLASMEGVSERINSLSIACIPNGYVIPLFSNGVKIYIQGLLMKDQKKKFYNYLTLMYSEKYLNEPSPQDKTLSRFELMYKKELLKKETPSFITTLGHQMGYAFYYLKNKHIETLKKNDIPIVYIHGSDDKISTLKHTQSTILNKLNLDGFFKIKGGHTINLEKPNEFNSIVENHILKHHQKIKLYQPSLPSSSASPSPSSSFGYYLKRNNILVTNNIQRNTLGLLKSKFSTLIKLIIK